ncbi:Tat pathway signal protein [Phenylobacterium sp.]|uniref:Tat pathway signal protein n=1 Tax=Phenylobacterium sp. TaxID=1871053 RepID=UPI002732F44E|nr:Tat pathway signal protein [Phenylobacterium sp.]MDP3659249.1 Tat pathway signal protein [Phenylobacterium sp.]
MNRRDILAAIALLSAVPGMAAASEKKAEKKKGGGESYIQISSLTATAIRPSGKRGVFTVETGIDVPDGALRNRAELNLPRLRAAYVQVVQTYAAGLSPTSAPNADFLARELQRETDRVLGKKGARLLLGTLLLN